MMGQKGSTARAIFARTSLSSLKHFISIGHDNFLMLYKKELPDLAPFK